MLNETRHCGGCQLAYGTPNRTLSRGRGGSGRCNRSPTHVSSAHTSGRNRSRNAAKHCCAQQQCIGSLDE